MYKLSPKKIIKQYDLNNRLFKISVPDESPIIETSLAELKLPAKYMLCMMKIHRKSQEGINLLPMTYQEMAGPTSVIHAKDELYVQGEVEDIRRFVEDYHLEMQGLVEGKPMNWYRSILALRRYCSHPIRALSMKRLALSDSEKNII